MNRRTFLGQSTRWGLGTVGFGLAGRRLPACGAAEPARSLRRPATGPLRVHPDNRRYFTDGSGRAVYLTGSHTWSNLADIGPTDPPARFDFGAHLDWMERLDHNFIRMWTWEPVSFNTTYQKRTVHHTVAPHPWARTGPGRALDGKPRFDLTRFDPEYFDRLQSRVAAAGERGIYVSVMLFEGWAMQFSEGAWLSHAFHSKNNVNGIRAGRNEDGRGLEIYTLADRRITALQEGYVRKVVDTVNDLDNVLFEISNENHPDSTAWQYHMIRYVRECERGKARKHPVGMTFQYRGGSNAALFDSPADWISPNRKGGYRDDPPASDGSKVVLNDTDHLWGIGGNHQWVWKSFVRGLNPIFMDPYDGVVLGRPFDSRWDPIHRSLGYTRRLAERMNLAAMAPHDTLASSKYCLARPGKEYVVYIPGGGAVTVDLSAVRGRAAVEWINPTTGARTAGKTTSEGEPRELIAPFSGDAVTHISAVE